MLTNVHIDLACDLGACHFRTGVLTEERGELVRNERRLHKAARSARCSIAALLFGTLRGNPYVLVCALLESTELGLQLLDLSPETRQSVKDDCELIAEGWFPGISNLSIDDNVIDLLGGDSCGRCDSGFGLSWLSWS